jgi:TonB family protein
MKAISFISALILTITLFVRPTSAQEKETDSRAVFNMVEEMPKFPGEEEGLKAFIMNKVRYPKEAQEKGIQGKVFVQFIIDTDGSVTDARIAKGVDPLLDQEALRVVNSMPKWKPGKQKGMFVKVSYTLPVNFALDGGKPTETSASLKAEFMGNMVMLSGDPELIEKLIPYMMGVKPGTALEKDKGTLIFSKPEGEPEEPVFYMVEEMPVYPGGEIALRKFIANEIKYPVEAQKDTIQGRVYVTFIVDKEGLVQEPKIARGVHPSLDKEALRVVSGLPQWVPGRQRGQAVKVSYTVPISFVLQ